MPNNSDLLWSFITSVFFPVFIVQIIIYTLAIMHQRAYSKAGLPRHYLQHTHAAKRRELESRENYRNLRVYSDLRLVLGLLRIPLLILLFFNFQNRLHSPNQGPQYANQGSASWGFGGNEQSQQNRNRITMQSGSAGQQQAFYLRAGAIGWRLMLMLLVSAYWLWLLRLHPSANQVERWNLASWWAWWHQVPGGLVALNSLKQWWQWQVPLMLMAQMHFLPASWQPLYNTLLTMLSIVFLSYTLYQLRQWVRLQDRYIHALDQLGEPLGIVKLRYYKERIALQAKERAKELRQVALSKHEQSLKIVYGLIVLVSLLGYWW